MAANLQTVVMGEWTRFFLLASFIYFAPHMTRARATLWGAVYLILAVLSFIIDRLAR